MRRHACMGCVHAQVADMAVPGMTSAYAAQCTADLVANETGLVLLETAVGDWQAAQAEPGAQPAGLNNSAR